MIVVCYVCDGCRSMHIFGIDEVPVLVRLERAGWSIRGWDEDLCPDCAAEPVVTRSDCEEIRMRVVEMTEVGDVECVAETDKAILCRSPLWDEKFWVPKSVLGEETEVGSRGDVGTLVLALWFAEKEGLL